MEYYKVEEKYPYMVIISEEKYKQSIQYNIPSKNMLVWLQRNLDERNSTEKDWIHIKRFSNHEYYYNICFHFKNEDDCVLFSLHFL